MYAIRFMDAIEMNTTQAVVCGLWRGGTSICIAIPDMPFETPARHALKLLHNETSTEIAQIIFARFSKISTCYIQYCLLFIVVACCTTQQLLSRGTTHHHHTS